MNQNPAIVDRQSARIGQPVSRVDGIAKVTGQAKYAADHNMPGLLYGWVASSRIARGRLTDIDESAARAVPGVVEVISHRNRPHLPGADRKYTDEVSVPGSPFRPLYSDEIQFSGQPIALVLADSLEAARHAGSLLGFSYEAHEHNTDMEKAMPERRPPSKKRMGFSPPKARGDAQAAYDAAPLKIAADYHLPTHHHNPMEMHAATVIWEGEDRITVYDKTQGPQNVQAYLAHVLGFSKKNIRVLNPYVGGAFGSGLRPQYHVILAAMAAKMLKRSVRVALSRQQMFTHVHRPEAIQSVALATDTGGRLQAIINEAATATSRFEEYMETVVNWGLINYACPNASGDYNLVRLDTYTPGDMRAPGAATGMTLFEMAIDEMAYEAHLDPLDFRMLNYSDKDAMADRPFTSKALREAYQQGATRFGWQRRNPLPRSTRQGRELVGYGVATGMWDATFTKASARATLGADGRLTVEAAASDIGPGTYTMMALVASDTLGIPVEDIIVNLGDSSLPKTMVQGGSWTAATTGAAVQLACLEIGKTLLRAAKKIDKSPLEDTELEDVEFRDGYLHRKGEPRRRVTITEAMKAGGLLKIEKHETAMPGIGDLVTMFRKSRNTHSAIFVEARVDEELNIVRVPRIVIAVAAGRILNPKLARSQVLGGVVMGVGMALHEESQLDHRFGRYMNHSFAEYHIPTNADIGDIEVLFVDEPDAEVSPLGVKGLGEIGIVGVAAAVANAVFHATGRRVRDLPITLDKIGLESAREDEAARQPEAV